MSKSMELRRHTDNDGDLLTSDGIRAAVEIGRGLEGRYDLLVSSGAQRATQTVACLVAGLGCPVPGGAVVEPRLRSEHEDRWRELYRDSGTADLEAMRRIDASFVDAEAEGLASALLRIFGALPAGGRALAVGHSPTNEAAVLGLTGEAIEPLAKGGGVLVVEDAGGRFTVERLGGDDSIPPPRSAAEPVNRRRAATRNEDLGG
jgi:broad specificity phosphatase PhoE